MGWKHLHAAVCAAVCLGSTPAVAQIYKCVGENGKVTYAANPCYGEKWQRFENSSQAEIARRKATSVPAPPGDRSTPDAAPSASTPPNPRTPIDGTPRLETVRDLNPAPRQP